MSHPTLRTPFGLAVIGGGDDDQAPSLSLIGGAAGPVDIVDLAIRF